MVNDMSNPIFVGKLRAADPPFSYLKWRDTVAQREENLINALEKLTAPELRAAKDRLLGGLAAERLDPMTSRGDFHYAAGILDGLLYKAGHKPNAGS